MYDWLIDHIPEPVKKWLGLKTNYESLKQMQAKNYSKPKNAKIVYGGGNKSSNVKIQVKSEDNIIKKKKSF